MMLREMTPLWESAELLGDMFTRLVNEEREKRRNEEERWLITEVGPSGSVSATSLGGPPEGYTGVPMYPDIAGRKSQTSHGAGRVQSYSSEEEGTMGDSQTRLHSRQSHPQQYPTHPHPHQYQPHPILQANNNHTSPHHPQVQASHWQVRGGYNLPPLANPGPSSSTILPRMQTEFFSPITPGHFAPLSVASEVTQAMLDENDAVCGLKRTGIWMNPI